MAVPLLTKKIVKKRVKHFKRPQSDRKISVKVLWFPKHSDLLCCFMCFVKSLLFVVYSKVENLLGSLDHFPNFAFWVVFIMLFD